MLYHPLPAMYMIPITLVIFITSKLMNNPGFKAWLWREICTLNLHDDKNYAGL